MKLGRVSKLTKINKTTLKKFGESVMSENSAVIVIFPNYDQFGAIRK